MFFILGLILTGLIVGALGRLLLPGPDPMSIPMTIVLGIVGSLIAGLIARAVFNEGAGFIFAVVVTVGLVWLVRRSRGRAVA